jgi:hypothetical protein
MGPAIAGLITAALVQGLTPDEFRGRVSSAEYAVGAGVPQLGNFRAGTVASVTSATSAVSGGLTTIAGAALIGLLIPALAAFRAPARPAADAHAGQPQPGGEPPPSQRPGRPGPRLILTDHAAPGHESAEPPSS